MRIIKLLLIFPVLAALSPRAEYTVSPGAVKTSASPLRTGRVTGTVLPVWNAPDIYARMKRGLGEQGFRLFRFPNGSLSNQYHWNGAGTYDSTGIWHPDSAIIKPGFLSNTRYRGTTKNNYGSIFYSNLTDGVDSTIWWSDPLGGVDPWVAVDLGKDQAVDSMQITWGKLRPDSVIVGALTTAGWNAYSATDVAFSRRGNSAVTGSVTTLIPDPGSMRYLAVRPVGIDGQGVQIGEIRAWSKGVLVSSNVADQAKQSQAWAMSAHPGNKRSTDWGGTGTPDWTFTMFMDYLKTIPGSEALICVNYGTGTPEEAAAWVRYANVQNHMGIHLWQVGNEIDGEWEEGGPVTAKQYARKYLAFVKAMKAVDPSILVMGPTLSTYEFSTTGSAELDGSTWAEEFLRLVGEAETADGKRYLDGFDFHAYPYYTSGTPTASDMLAAMRGLKPNLDTLAAMMARRLQDPGSRLVSMSEFNASVASMNLTMRSENATGMAMMLAQLIDKFGGQSMSIAWESYGASSGNPDGSAGGTYGTLSLFVPARSNAASSIDVAPNAPYWGNWMVSKVWAIDSAKALSTTVSGGNLLEVHALTDGTDTSYLFQNMSAVACTAQVTQPSARGWIYSFSSEQYAWNGATSSAYASPNSGPSSQPLPASWNGKVTVPAFGMAVLRTSASTSSPAKDHVVQMSVNNQQLDIGDTLVISGTLIRKPDAPAPKAKLGDSTVDLLAADGTWDGPQEAFIARVQAKSIGVGQFWLRLGDSDSIRIFIVNSALVHPTVWLDRFEDTALSSDQPSKAPWWPLVAGGAPSSLNLSFPIRASGGQAFLSTVNLKQASNLGYTVYGLAGLRLDRNLVTSSVGIKFDFASWHSAKGTFNLQFTTDTVLNGDNYIIDLPATDSVWRTIRLTWSNFQQQGWGGVLTGPLQARQISSLAFRVNGEGSAKFWIDNLALLGTTGDSISGILPVKSARKNWSLTPRGDGWQFELPAGSTLRLIGLDGRLVRKFEARLATGVFYHPQSTGILFAELEIDGHRYISKLPMLR